MFYMGRGSDGRMPTYSQTDLVRPARVQGGRGKRLQLSLNVLNLFNQATATNFFPTENISGEALEFDEADFYAHKLDFQTLKAQQKLGTDAAVPDGQRLPDADPGPHRLQVPVLEPAYGFRPSAFGQRSSGPGPTWIRAFLRLRSPSAAHPATSH